MTQLIITPTFPLNQREIHERIWKIKTGHPLTWASFGGAAILPWIIANGVGAAVFGTILCLGIAAFGMSAFWKSRESATEARVIEELIAESNADQDRRLSGVVRRFRAQGQNHYASALGKFLLLKQSIEKRLHPEGSVTELSEQIERLVDNLCASVCREFDKVTLLDNKLGDVLISGNSGALEKLQTERTEVLEAIMKAYGTLYESLESVVDFDNSSELVPELKTSGPDADTDLKETVDSLKAEIEMARRIRDRISIPDRGNSLAETGVFEREKEM